VFVAAQTFAVKELCYGDMKEDQRRQLVNEVNILRDLNSKHVVRWDNRPAFEQIEQRDLDGL
jgi:hypothetical protein